MTFGVDGGDLPFTVFAHVMEAPDADNAADAAVGVAVPDVGVTVGRGAGTTDATGVRAPKLATDACPVEIPPARGETTEIRRPGWERWRMEVRDTAAGGGGC